MAASVSVMSASASAAGWNCSAAALCGQPLGTPVTANVGQTTCKAASGGANLPALPLPLQANVMSARTTLDGPATQPAQQTAGATGEVASLSIGVPSGSAPIPTQTIPVPGMGNVDITQALVGAAAAAAQPAGRRQALERHRLRAAASTASPRSRAPRASSASPWPARSCRSTRR